MNWSEASIDLRLIGDVGKLLGASGLDVLEYECSGGGQGAMLTHLMHLEDLSLSCGAEKLRGQSVRGNMED